MRTRFEAGQGITWWNRYEGDMSGVVMSVSDHSIDVVPVFPLVNGVLCYDDPGSEDPKYADNVRLKDSPPPFSMLSVMSGNAACYAAAGRDSWIVMSEEDVEQSEVSVLDGGDRISDRDMQAILYHPRPAQKEKALPYRRAEPEYRAEPVAVKSKPMSAMDRLRAAAALTDGIEERDAGPEGPGF